MILHSFALMAVLSAGGPEKKQPESGERDPVGAAKLLNTMGLKGFMVRPLREDLEPIRATFAQSVRGACANAEDGEAVWGTLYYLHALGVKVDHKPHVEAGNAARDQARQEDRGAAVAEQHLRMRSLGVKTIITPAEEDSMQRQLNAGFDMRYFGDTLHMLRAMIGFTDLADKPELTPSDGFASAVLADVRQEKDGARIAWAHVNLRERGMRTQITIDDERLMQKGYEESLGKGRGDELAGWQFLHMRLHNRAPAGQGLSL